MKTKKRTNVRKINKSKLKEKNIIAAVFVTVLTLLVIVVSYIRISVLTEQRCLERLQEAVNTVMDDINNKLSRDSNILNAVAEIISMEDNFDTETMRGIMTQFSALTTAKNINLLLPGDIVIGNEGKEFDAYGKISFEGESAKGEHVTDRMTSITDDEKMLIRHFVPVVKNGETVAMVYASTLLENLPKSLNISNIYNGTATVYLIDRSNGDFLMNTLHNELGNISDFNDKETKGHNDAKDVRKKILEGKSGYIVSKSTMLDKYMYFYYAPVNVEEWELGEAPDYNQWTVAVAVPEDEAFANLYRIRSVCYLLGIFETIILIIYFIWTIRNTNATLEKAVLEERLVKAENAERAKTMFLSNMSHDIRTPMNAIIGYTTLAAANLDNKERVKDYLSKTISSSNHLLSLINDILDMSRIESGRVYIEETECSLPDVLHDLRNILQSQMKSKQLNFFIDTIDVVDEDVYCDRLHLNQVLLNLLSNAIKFTPAGGSVSLTIKQKHGAPEGYASYEISVKDTGIGMAPEFLDRVFDPFERELTSTVSGIQGTGLGMAIAKNIIDMMGGTIEVKSEQGKGTEFIISFELRLQSEKKQVEVIKELEGLRALVVDDDYNVCDSVTKMLVQLGMRADWTLSGKEAVLHAKQAYELADEFNAYIIDWQLPDLNGIEVVRRLRKAIGESTPIIILTAYDWEGIEDEAREAGVTAFCSKPIFLSTLRDTLLSATGRPEPTKEEPIIPESSGDIAGKRILLVEDNELNREIAETILVESGLLVETAEDGTVAVEKVMASDDGYYDLILMDIQMPVMNGYDATIAIRNLKNPAHSSIPIVAMTANAFNEDKEQAIKCGMNDHIAKPLDMEKLFDVLRKYLGGSKQ